MPKANTLEELIAEFKKHDMILTEKEMYNLRRLHDLYDDWEQDKIRLEINGEFVKGNWMFWVNTKKFSFIAPGYRDITMSLSDDLELSVVDSGPTVPLEILEQLIDNPDLVVKLQGNTVCGFSRWEYSKKIAGICFSNGRKISVEHMPTYKQIDLEVFSRVPDTLDAILMVG